MTNPNTEYEKLVAEIHQAMLDYDGYEALRVEHDVTLTGKSGATHQIDVFWEFVAAGITYRTCIECKNYKSAVKKTHIAAFATILEDIGNANGIIATTRSFQKGAKLLAQEKNIRLVLVNNLLKTVHLTYHPRITKYQNCKIEFDIDLVKQLLDKSDREHFEIDQDILGEDPLFDKDGNNVETFNTLIQKEKIMEGQNRIDISELYIQSEIGMLRVKSFSFDLVYSEVPAFTDIINVNDETKAVLEEIVDKNIYYLNDDGSISNT